MHWREWKPKLSSKELLGDVLYRMPRVSPDKIPWQVRLLENPESWISFPGAISLFGHDCVHAILCASFHPLDEAYVIGLTMGSDRRMTSWLARIFMWMTTWFYPKKYRFSKCDLAQFAKGFARARKSKVQDLARFPFENYQQHSLEDMRNILGITWLNSEKDYVKWARRWSIYQFCTNDECRFESWLRVKSGKAESPQF